MHANDYASEVMSFGRTAIFKGFSVLSSDGTGSRPVVSVNCPSADDSEDSPVRNGPVAATKRPKRAAQSVSATAPKPTVDIEDPCGVVDPGETVDTPGDDFVRGDSSGSRRRF